MRQLIFNTRFLSQSIFPRFCPSDSIRDIFDHASNMAGLRSGCRSATGPCRVEWNHSGP
ncbi:unnamed protein product [Penicillium roqueforti FM164]|uniref:Genomic scaffold, ProqFM164S01 n=1 Tax=Penicillium roqueforti (strain FM164) TaxID=1365484 RepID=W6QD15_PENRF|nr:unnamed protein product [Penicillium roqueforti FM164]